MDVNGLPDDMLARIFSELPPLMLLDNVPLVCKRWHLLCRHPDSWRNFNFIMPLVPSASKKELKDLARLARAAPYIHSVDFLQVAEVNAEVTAIVKALLKEQKTVKSLHTLQLCSKRMRAYTKNMLQKWSPSLRKLLISFPSPETMTSISEEYHTSINKILTLLSEIPHLQSLYFVLLDVPYFKNYNGQLGKGCPSLEKFVVRSLAHGCAAFAEYNSFIFDVLENKKEKLRMIEFTVPCEPVEKFMNVVGACHNVEECRVSLEILPVVKHMSQLRILELFFMPDDECVIEDSYEELRAFIEGSKVIENLSELNLTEPLLYYDPLSEPGYHINRCLEALALKIRDLKVFRVCDVCFIVEFVLRFFFSNMKGINSICLLNSLGASSLSGHHFDLLKNSNNLKQLQIIDLEVPTQHVKNDIENSIKNLQLSQPQLKVECNIEIVNENEFDNIFDPYNDYDDFDDYMMDGYYGDSLFDNLYDIAEES